MSDIIWPEEGILHLDIPSLVGIDRELSLVSFRPVQNKVVTRAFKHIHNDIEEVKDKLEKNIRNLYSEVSELKDKKLDDLSNIIDASQPENGQLLAYVKEGNSEGYWKLTEAPSVGDVLVFNGSTWKAINLSQIIIDLIGETRQDGLWKISDNHRLVPNSNVIREIDSQFNGDIATSGSIYSENLNYGI